MVWRDFAGFAPGEAEPANFVVAYFYGIGGESLAIGAFLAPGVIALGCMWRILNSPARRS